MLHFANPRLLLLLLLIPLLIWRYIRNVRRGEGSLRFASTLALEGIQGVLDGMPARLSGQVVGFDAESLGADLEVWAGNVDLEEKRKVLEGVAPYLAALYDQYRPKGRVDVAVRLQREPAADAPVRTSGTVFCRDVEMTYFRFPYRLTNLQGTVRFGPEGFEIDRLAGRHGPATVELTGYARNPGPRVDALVEVHARGVALDEDLHAAMTPGQRPRFARSRILPSATN